MGVRCHGQRGLALRVIALELNQRQPALLASGPNNGVKPLALAYAKVEVWSLKLFEFFHWARSFLLVLENA